ncbi:MAG: hypothetical protein Q9M97_06180 [Candidatus Gracilibacteria bacterium]|nr:hypothetical protein [Candidatus Gracilibacteria bacterium]
MRKQKSDRITIRINPLLKEKFNTCLVFSGLSEVLNNFIIDYVRKYEAQYGIIPVRASQKINMIL